MTQNNTAQKTTQTIKDTLHKMNTMQIQPVLGYWTCNEDELSKFHVQTLSRYFQIEICSLKEGNLLLFLKKGSEEALSACASSGCFLPSAQDG
jgi:hypothetical protein